MMDKDKLVAFVGASGDRKARLLRVLDQAEQATRKHELIFTDFLSPDTVDDAVKCLTQVHDLCFHTDGGYEDAEYAVMALYPDWMEREMVESPLMLVDVEKLQTKREIGHRDVLGSVLGLGIKREKIGDLIVWEDAIQIITTKEMASFLEVHLTKIGSTKVKASMCRLSDIKLKPPVYEQVNGTVKSLRLDAVIAIGFRLSRGKAADMIKGDKVKVNYRYVSSPAFVPKPGDLVSVRGKGRLIYDGEEGVSKKDRLYVRMRLVK